MAPDIAWSHYLSDMKQLLLILVTVLASGSIARAQSADERAVMALHLKKFEWMVQKDTVALQGILLPDLRYTHSNGYTEDVRTIIRNLSTRFFDYQKIEVKEYASRKRGKTIAVHGSMQVTMNMSDKPLVIDLVYTEVYVKVKRQWKLWTRHAARLIPM